MSKPSYQNEEKITKNYFKVQKYLNDGIDCKICYGCCDPFICVDDKNGLFYCYCCRKFFCKKCAKKRNEEFFDPGTPWSEKIYYECGLGFDCEDPTENPQTKKQQN